MHQHQRAVAQLNNQPEWPEGYMAVLREAGAQEKHLSFCVSWVRSFFARYPGRRRRDLGRTEIEAFLAELAKRPAVSNWQLQQARNAIELYYEQFRGIPLDPRPDRSIAPTIAATQGPASASRYGKTQAPSKRIADPIPAPIQTPTAQPTPHDPSRVKWPILERVTRERLRIEHYSYSTEQSYLAWIRRFVTFHQWRKPSTLNAQDVHAFLQGGWGQEGGWGQKGVGVKSQHSICSGGDDMRF